jgi:hypothetical protein
VNKYYFTLLGAHAELRVIGNAESAKGAAKVCFSSDNIRTKRPQLTFAGQQAPFFQNFVSDNKKSHHLAVLWGTCVLLRRFSTRYQAPGGPSPSF